MLHRLTREGSSPLIILLHGLGSDERDLLGLAPALDPSWTVLTLRAPKPYEMGGYAWFDIDWTEEGIAVDIEGVARSLEILEAEVSAIVADREGPVVLGGFSQGAIMSLALSFVRPALFQGVWLMSGAAVPALFPSEAPRPTASYLVQHGTDDMVLSVELGREVAYELDRRSANTQYIEYPMGHEVSPASIRDADSWLATFLVV